MSTVRRRLARVPALRRARRYWASVRGGTSPAWLALLNLRRISRDATTFNDKILHKMGHDRRPILTQFADKSAVRRYVADRVGSDILTTVYADTRDPSTIDWDSLPPQYVAKATHGSGCVIIVSDAAPAEAALPTGQRAWWSRYLIRPAAADRDRVTALMMQWMRLRYDVRPGHPPEWCYRNIPPGVLIEEFLVDDDGNIPRDYKFFVFDGSVRFVQVESDRATGHKRDTFTPDWTLVAVTGNYPRSATPPQKPRNFDRMLEVAATLGQGIDFVRVDLYSIGGRVLFGELTNYPEGGRVRLDPPSFDELWGTYWSLPTGRLR